MAKRLVEPEYDVYKVDEVDLVLERDFYIVGNATITSSEIAANIFMQFWKENLLNVQEQMSVMLLSQSNKVIGMYQHSKGAINATTMDIQLISAVAVKSLAKGVIVAHNHPSGNLTPSDADKKMTQMLKKALELFNINLIDSLIITSDNSKYYSLLDSGMMESGGMLFADGGVMTQNDYDYYYLYAMNNNEGEAEWVQTKIGKTPEEDMGYWDNYCYAKESDLQPKSGRYAGYYWVLLTDEQNPIGYWHKLEDGGNILDNSKQKTLEELDRRKNELIKKAEPLIAKKKKLYSNVDIESPMSADEKKLIKDINDLLSEANQIVMDKRKIIKGGYMADGGQASILGFKKGDIVIHEATWAQRPQPLYEVIEIAGFSRPTFSGKEVNILKLKDLKTGRIFTESENRLDHKSKFKDGGYMASGGKIKEPKPQMISEAYELGRLAFLSGKKNIPFYDKALSDLIKSKGGSSKTYIDYSDSWSKGYLYEMLEEEDKLTGEREGERKAGMDEYFKMGGKVTFKDKVYMADGGQASILGFKKGDIVIHEATWAQRPQPLYEVIEIAGFSRPTFSGKEVNILKLKDLKTGRIFTESENRLDHKSKFKDGGYMASGGKIKEPKPQMISEAYELGRLAFLSGKKNIPFYDKALSDLIKSKGGSSKTYIDYSDSWSKGYLYEMLEEEDKLTGEREGERKAGMDEYFKMGGKVTFKDKVEAIKSKLLEYKKVPLKVRKDYGETFSPNEAEDSAKRIAGSMVAKGKIKNKK